MIALFLASYLASQEWSWDKVADADVVSYRNVDLPPSTVLGGAPAVGTLLVGDLVRGASRAGAGSDHGAAERLDEVCIADLGASLLGDDRVVHLPPPQGPWTT